MTHYDLVSSNVRKTWYIIIGFFILIMGLSYIMVENYGFGLNVMGLALIFAGGSGFVSYWFSDKIILSISGAREAQRSEFFDFYTVAENISYANGLPMPKLYVIEDTAINAFATGRDPKHAVVCATTGLLQRLNRAEVEGVVAHELAHVKNYDIRLMSVVTILVGMIALISDWMLRMTVFGGRKNSDERGGSQLQMVLFIVGILLALLSPVIAQLIKFAVSRQREYLADASAIAMTKNPEGLARALEKISQDQEPLEAANKATAHLYIGDPLKNHHDAVGWFSGLFATHPPITERIAILRGMTR